MCLGALVQQKQKQGWQQKMLGGWSAWYVVTVKMLNMQELQSMYIFNYPSTQCQS